MKFTKVDKDAVGTPNIPTAIDILGVLYKIQQKPVVSKLEPRKGEINYLDCTITIDESLPDDVKHQVLFHEILHGICELLGLYDIAEDENKVQALATGLHLVLKANNLISF